MWTALPLFHIGGVAFAVATLFASGTYVHTGHYDPGVALHESVPGGLVAFNQAVQFFGLVAHPEVPRWARPAARRCAERGRTSAD